MAETRARTSCSTCSGQRSRAMWPRDQSGPIIKCTRTRWDTWPAVHDPHGMSKRSAHTQWESCRHVWTGSGSAFRRTFTPAQNPAASGPALLNILCEPCGLPAGSLDEAIAPRAPRTTARSSVVKLSRVCSAAPKRPLLLHLSHKSGINFQQCQAKGRSVCSATVGSNSSNSV